MTDDNRGSGGAGVRVDLSLTANEAETQDGLSRLLAAHDVRHYREVWFRPMASISVLDTQTNARRADFYIEAVDPEHGSYSLVVELKQRRDSKVYKQLREVTAQMLGARAGFGWFTQDGERLPSPDWPVYGDQYSISGVTPPEEANRPEAAAYAERVWWANGCGTLFRDWRGLIARVPSQRFNRGKRTPDVKYLDLWVCP